MTTKEAREALMALEHDNKALRWKVQEHELTIRTLHEQLDAFRKRALELEAEVRTLKPRPMNPTLREAMISAGGLEGLQRYEAMYGFSAEVYDDVE